MTRVLVLYYSSWGHVESMAHAVAEGARAVAGVSVEVKRVPETLSAEVVAKAEFKTEQSAPVAQPEDLPHYDAIVFGTSTRFGNMAAQMRAFLDRTGSLWQSHALVGKVGSVFVATGTQHGGQETSITSFHSTLFHHGMVVVGLPYTFVGQLTMQEITGGSPYGAATLAGDDGARAPSENELAGARFQGRIVAEIARDLRNGRAFARRRKVA